MWQHISKHMAFDTYIGRDCPESSEVECEKSETKTDATEMTGVK